MPDVRRLPATNVLSEFRKPNERPASRQVTVFSHRNLFLHTEFIGLLCDASGGLALFTSVVAG